MVNILLNFSDFFHSKPPFHIIIGKCQLSCGDMRQVKMRYKLRKKRCWAWQCIFPSTTTLKWKNIKINIKKEKFKKILKNWSWYRSEISPAEQFVCFKSKSCRIKTLKVCWEEGPPFLKLKKEGEDLGNFNLNQNNLVISIEDVGNLNSSLPGRRLCIGRIWRRPLSSLWRWQLVWTCCQAQIYLMTETAFWQQPSPR